MKEPKSTTSSAVVAPAPAMSVGDASGVRVLIRRLGESVMSATIADVVAIE
ncbi:hypothetical protein GCM10022224_009340 [Nonomuraea antimicrobica]|uniref:Uncharacterized protein n=1 Tax=Nonomuraea antimicrobica TaxID=561173 RepID=A0ABP7B5P7_9ACTN